MYQPDETHPHVRIGHVHLRVADLERATAFYRDVLGFTVTAYGPDHGLAGAAFLSAGGYHHHVGLNTWMSEGGEPDGNGIELYYDRPRVEWFDPRGNPILKAEPFDPRELLAELDPRLPVEASQPSKED